MNEEYIYSMPHTVIYSETDARGLLSLPAFFALFQEGALLQAEKLGFGESYCKKEGLMWVLSRVLLEIESFPAHRSQIQLLTWPKKPKGPFAIRDYKITSENGTAHANATSSWLLLNSETMRPVRPQPLFSQLPVDKLGEALAETAPKVSGADSECSRELEVTARYSDLDQNNHVNNTRYVRWFLDCFTPEEVTPDGNLRFSINYLQAAAFNDRVKLCRHDSGTHTSVHGYLDDGSETFAAQIRLHQK
ncbi:MAG TPA: acyl-ACP thioesterase domain-containing protein [Clostridia bacterium]|nr:acyl-ACP thioesterase domain-containing protein [Clostridia bacterium]